MDDTNTTYRVPEGFSPYTTADAVRGLTDSIHQFLFEGPGTQRTIPHGDRAALNALVELLQAEVHTLHAYLQEIENRLTLELPKSDADFDAPDVRYARKDEFPKRGDFIREAAAVYAIR